MFEIFQFIGETELHIETLRQKVCKEKTFESYDVFRTIGGRDSMKSQQGITHRDIYRFLLKHCDDRQGFKENFKEDDLVHLVNFHSHNRDGYLSYTDFNQMILPVTNHKLRAKATQRNMIFQTTDGTKTTNANRAYKRVVQFLIAEACLNLDFEMLKMKLEQSDKGFNTQHLFQLVDIRQYNYLDIKSIQIFMEQYYQIMKEWDRRHVAGNPYRSSKFYLDTSSEFLKAIMRRLGLEHLARIDYRQFSNIVKPTSSETVIQHFRMKSDKDRMEHGSTFQRYMARHKIRTYEHGKQGEQDHVGPLQAFKNIMIDKTPQKEDYSVVTGRLEYISETDKENSNTNDIKTFDSRKPYDPKIHNSFEKVPSFNNTLKNQTLKSRFDNQGPIRATKTQDD